VNWGSRDVAPDWVWARSNYRFECLKLLDVSRVVVTNIVAIGARSLGVDVDDLELDEECEQAAERAGWERWVLEMSVQLAARWIGARGVVECCLEQWEVPLEGTVVLGRTCFEGFEVSCSIS
jgi:hypothetical protein